MKTGLARRTMTTLSRMHVHDGMKHENQVIFEKCFKVGGAGFRSTRRCCT